MLSLFRSLNHLIRADWQYSYAEPAPATWAIVDLHVQNMLYVSWKIRELYTGYERTEQLWSTEAAIFSSAALHGVHAMFAWLDAADHKAADENGAARHRRRS